MHQPCQVINWPEFFKSSVTEEEVVTQQLNPGKRYGQQWLVFQSCFINLIVYLYYNIFLKNVKC